MSIIEIRHLTKDYGAVRAVDDLSFGVDSGQIVGFLGPNGSGKTTTLSALLGLVTPTSGTATIDGLPYAELTAPLSVVGAMLEAAAHPARSGRGQLRVLAAEAGVPRSRVDELLRLVELEGAADRRAGGYSLGMRQRLGLAGALMGDPGILVLDEPANGLDPEGIRWLRDFLRGLAAEGRTVLLSSHVLSEVAQTVDSVVVIQGGRLMVHESLEELTGESGGRIRVQALAPDAMASAVLSAGLDLVARDGDLLTIAATTRRDVAELAFVNGIVLTEITEDASSLEEVFMTLTSPKAQEALS
jgi:ABC-2 type transport system ATP-binding protein